MGSNKIIKALATVACSLLTACASTTDSSKINYLTNGVVGAAVGAGTGAAIGSVIANGDVAASALLGGGIGLAAGIVVPPTYRYVKTEMTIAGNDRQINRNRRDINATQQEIDTIRQQIRAQSTDVVIDEGMTEHVYDGPTIGVPNR